MSTKEVVDEPTRAEALAQIPLFAGLPAVEVERLAARCSSRSYSKGDSLWEAGDEGEELLVISSGELAVWGDGHDGEEVIARVGPGECVGEMALLLDEPRSATITCLRRAEVIVLGKADFRELVRDNAQVLASISQVLSRRVASLAHRRPAARTRTVAGVAAVGGASGASLVAAALAAMLAEVSGSEALLVRLGPEGGAVSKLTSTGLGSSRRPLGPSGASVVELALPDDASPVAALERVVHALTRWPGDVVLDIPADSDADLISLAETCDLVVQVAADETAPPAVAHTRVLRVVNRHGGRAGAIPITACEPFVLADTAELREASVERQVEVLLTSRQLPIARTLRRLARKTLGACVGIAFGGGAAFGIAHVGVLEALEKGGVEVDLVAGTSMGSIVALGYGSGLSPTDLHEMAGRLGTVRTTLSILDPTLAGTGILAGRRLMAMFSPLVPAATFEDLVVPCQVVATDIESGERVCIGTGRIDAALRASCSIPILFTPVRSGDRTLVDGAMVDPVPAEVARAMGADLVIGVNVVPQLERGTTTVISRAFKRVNRFNPLSWRNGAQNLPDIVDVLMNSLQTMQYELGNFKALSADVRLNVDLADMTWIEFHRALEIIERGRSAAEAVLPQVQAALDQRLTLTS